MLRYKIIFENQVSKLKYLEYFLSKCNLKKAKNISKTWNLLNALLDCLYVYRNDKYDSMEYCSLLRE